MKLAIALAATAAALSVPVSADAATVINLDGRANSSATGSNAITQVFDAGRYTVSFVKDAYTAFSLWSSNRGCDSSGANCQQGYINSAAFIINGVETRFGSRAVANRYSTQAASFANAGQYTSGFTLTSPTAVSFYLPDGGTISDNRGGISLSIAGVPEPATWAFLLLGFGAIGGSMRSSRRRTLATA